LFFPGLFYLFSLFFSPKPKKKINPGKNNFLKTSKNGFLKKGFQRKNCFLFLFWREIERKKNKIFFLFLCNNAFIYALLFLIFYLFIFSFLLSFSLQNKKKKKPSRKNKFFKNK
jgi:hypothetical protein